MAHFLRTHHATIHTPHHPYHPRDHHFGLTIHPDDLLYYIEHPKELRSLHLAPQVGNKDPLSLITKDGFQISLDVQQFLPNEITVKVMENVITVEGKHDEKEDGYGCITRHFHRKYTLPQEIDCVDVVSTLSSDGILTLKAHKKTDGTVRTIHIQQTGPARHTIKTDHVEEVKKAFKDLEIGKID